MAKYKIKRKNFTDWTPPEKAANFVSQFWQVDIFFLGNRFAFGLSFGLDFWLGPNPTSRSQVSRIALEESETFYFIPLLSLSLSLSLSLLHSFAWDRQCQPVEQTQRKL